MLDDLHSAGVVSEEIIGVGIRVGGSARTSGIGRYVDGVDTVLKLMNEDVSELILIVHDAGTTGVAPILPDARGVICTSGGPTSHLALVSKEYAVCCVMAAKLDREATTLDGVCLTVDANGSIAIEAPAT